MERGDEGVGEIIRNVEDVTRDTTSGPGLRALFREVPRKSGDRSSAERTDEQKGQSQKLWRRS